MRPPTILRCAAFARRRAARRARLGRTATQLVLDAHQRLAETSRLAADYGGAVCGDRRGARACGVDDRSREPVHHQDQRAADHGPNPRGARLRPRSARGIFGVDLPEDREQVRALLQREIAGDSRARARRSASSKLLDLPTDDRPRQDRVDGAADCTACPRRTSSDQESYALSDLHDGPSVARSRQLPAFGARLRFVRGADCERAAATTRTAIASRSSASIWRTS